MCMRQNEQVKIYHDHLVPLILRVKSNHIFSRASTFGHAQRRANINLCLFSRRAIVGHGCRQSRIHQLRPHTRETKAECMSSLRPQTLVAGPGADSALLFHSSDIFHLCSVACSAFAARAYLSFHCTYFFFFSAAGGSSLVNSGGPPLRFVYWTSELRTRSRNLSSVALFKSSSHLARVRFPVRSTVTLPDPSIPTACMNPFSRSASIHMKESLTLPLECFPFEAIRVSSNPFSSLPSAPRLPAATTHHASAPQISCAEMEVSSGTASLSHGFLRASSSSAALFSRANVSYLFRNSKISLMSVNLPSNLIGFFCPGFTTRIVGNFVTLKRPVTPLSSFTTPIVILPLRSTETPRHISGVLGLSVNSSALNLPASLLRKASMLSEVTFSTKCEKNLRAHAY
eukprot:07019_2